MARGMVLGVGGVLVAAALLVAACGGDDDAPPRSSDPGQSAEQPAGTEPAEAAADGERQSGEADEAAQAAPPDEGGQAAQADGPPQGAAFSAQAPSTLTAANSEFNYATLIWQGYWLSRDHFGPFVMASGLGIPFEPPMDQLQVAMSMVGQNPDDPIMVPQNMMPLQAVYASAAPDLAQNPQDFEPLDFQAFRLDPATFDTTVRVGAMAQTMIKESQWSRNFQSSHFGALDGDFGAQQRFMGVMTSLLAQMQGRYAMQELPTADGLYADIDGAIDREANWALLLAFADLAGITAEESRYADPDAHAVWLDAGERLAEALTASTPESAPEAATAIRALAYYAWTVAADEADTALFAEIEAIAASLADLGDGSAADRGAQLIGWSHAAAVLGSDQFATAIDDALAALHDDFQPRAGVFASQSVYRVDEIAWILGGLNAVVLRGSDEARAVAGPMLVAFYESTLDLSGLQLSAPPGKDGAMAGEWEKALPSELFYHGADTPPPPAAGGEHGLLTVPAAEISWDGDAWSVSDQTFVVEGAMRLANELNWFHEALGAVPFPPVGAAAE